MEVKTLNQAVEDILTEETLSNRLIKSDLDLKQLAKHIKAYRAQLDISKKKLAKKLKLSVKEIEILESNPELVTFAQLNRVAEYLLKLENKTSSKN